MREKNRFSGLLKHLMTVAKLKNYSLAKELQYDESYISKWVTGSLLPTEKTSEKIFRDISRCVVTSLDGESRQLLYSEYQLDNDRDLQEAIFDNLEAEFRYVMDLKETTGSEIAQKTNYYPELTLAQFMQKMHHPVLRQVKSLEVIMVADILSLDRHYQLDLAELKSAANTNVSQRMWPGVHFSMLLNLNSVPADNSYHVLFLMKLLANLSNVDFQLYAGNQAQGKIIFAVKDAYSIAGMLMNEPLCLAVTASEDPKNCNALFDRVQSMCNQETLAVRRLSFAEIPGSNEYMQYTFTRNQRWLLNHLTEQLLPDDLFEELAEGYCATHSGTSKEQLRHLHMLSRSILESMEIRILVSEKSISEFALSGMVDFFNTRIFLTPQQRLQCLSYFATLPGKNPKLDIRILQDGTLPDLRHIPDPSLFLSDTYCLLRVAPRGVAGNISILNKAQLCERFRRYFDDLRSSVPMVQQDISAVEDILRYAQQIIQVQIQIHN